MPQSINDVDRKFMEEIGDLVGSNTSVDPTNVTDSVSLDETESIEWVASTYHEQEMLNLYRCIASDSAPSIVLSRHGDQGFVTGVDGPWKSISDAKGEIGVVAEGWTDI